ncbi:MAG: hypothetical protein V4520_04365 [Bacteroidota bacterium]
MKKSFILSAILFGSLVYNSAQAQISVHIGFNIPARRVYVPAPPPQPVMVYDNDEFDDSDEYYYLPEVEAYYSVPRHCYYYQDGGRWISAAYLPGAYRNYDWRTVQRYEIRGRRPYMHHDQYRNQWGGNYNRNNWNWNRRDNNYAGRNNRPDWNRDNNRNDWNRGNSRNDRPQGGYNQPGRDRGNQGGWAQPQQPNRDRGNWGGNGGQQPQQPNRNDDNRGGDRSRHNQPSQPGRNDNNGGGNRGGNDRAQLAQNRGGFGGGSSRPTRF